MGLTSNKKSFVASKYDQIGIYVWQMADGKYVMDENRNVLSIASRFGDVSRISKLAAAARQCGLNEGKPAFLPGFRKVTDEEYENQVDRMNNGLIPDEYDIAAHEEDLADRWRRGAR